MSAERNKAIIRQWVEQGWNKGDFSSVNGLYAADYAFNNPSVPPDFPKGPQAIVAVVSMYRAACNDLYMSVEELVAEGEKVSWRWVVTGTHTGPLMNIPPSGKSVRITGQVLSRFENGKWMEDYINWDTLGFMQQIGAIPVMG